ncbi:hypothetical protein [Pararhizobium qamdonense]|uniref:hypothetical protein n=1 Tax=Pararhizobium qamdonense TaxID=3031126 RepID=UPI0023E3176D|nr:hypothetical protein [Pararhizobium qamdonense]
MTLDFIWDLEPIKIAALADIDTQAEAVRGRFMTLGSGQAMVYDQKRDEAETFMENPDIAPGLIPHLVSESVMNGISPFDQAVIYLTMRQIWLTVSPVIEERRLAAKTAVAAATTPAAIYEAQSIDWSDLEALVA